MNIVVSFTGIHRRGGVERVALECVRHLASRGHAVQALASEFDPLPEGVVARPVKSLKKPFFLTGRSYFTRATEVLKTLECDVLNTHGCVCPGGGVHWVQSVHKAWIERSRQMRGPWSPLSVRQRLNPLHPELLRLEKWHFGGRNYKSLIVTTEHVRDDLHRLYDVPESDCTVVPNGFNPEEFNPQSRAARRVAERSRLGLEPSHIALLFVANELERKGYPVVLNAMQALKDPNLQLLCIGRHDVDLARRLAQESGLAGQVQVLGTCSDVAGMHAAADLFVLPTQYEAFSLAILESLGSGLPVLTSSVPGAGDAIISGVNGYTQEDPRSVEQLAEMLRPLLHHDSISTLSAGTPATVDRYQWPVVMQAFEAELVRALGVPR